MRLLFLGDVFGRSGRTAVIEQASALKKELKLDALIVNAENAARTAGITPQIADDLLAAGVDVITLGDHAFDRPEINSYLDQEKRIVRPINYPEGTPGRAETIFTTSKGKKLLVAAVQGNLFIRHQTDDGFRLADQLLRKYPLGGAVDAIFIDFHGEATSEKQAFAYYMDGRVSAVVGTHTHVPTADTRILPQGTGFQTDAGMCGDYNSVIGAEKEEPIRRFTKKVPGNQLEAALGEATLSGVFFELDTKGKCKTAFPFVRGPHLINRTPGS